MAHGVLKEFEPEKESMEDFRERFDFYCVANKIKNEGEDLRRKKALFVTLLGHRTFSKLKTLASPTPVADLTMEAIMELLLAHYRPQTIEIAERFKFFKRMQKPSETVVEFMSELRSLAKSCNFGAYLKTALRDQFVCGLRDTKCQQELLSISELTVEIAQRRAQAAEVVALETKSMKEPGTRLLDEEVNMLRVCCYRCGKEGHKSSDCRHKNTKCLACHKLGHLARVCQSGSRKATFHKGKHDKGRVRKRGDIKAVENDDSTEPSSDEQLHGIFQVGGKSPKMMVTVAVNGVQIAMEVDTGAERSTIPTALFEEKLATVCKIQPSQVTLRQYDQTPLKVVGQCSANLQIGEHGLTGVFIIVDIPSKHPLLGRDLLTEMGITCETLLKPGSVKAVTAQQTCIEEEIVTEYKDLFKKELGLLSGIEAEVSVEQTATPRFHKSRSVPFALRDKVEEALRAQVAAGELIPVERSEWAAPIVVVQKKDGGVRICGDFKVTINPVICPQVYPLPTPEEMFSALANGESFTRLDLARAYRQMKVKPECQHLLTINTHLGLFRHTRLPFGISTAPSLWQKAMAQILQGLQGVIVFIDDILVTGRTREEHIRNLRNVLDRLRQAGLRLKRSKCLFFQKSLEYLGHNISKEGVRPTDERVKCVLEAPPPLNKQQLKSFLGLTTYNAKFLPSLSHVLHPLNKLLKKNVQWKWTEEEKKSFDAVKAMVADKQCLAHYDVSKPLKVYCDASPKGLGACLTHVMANGVEQPVAYASRSLREAEQNYAQIEREALSIIFAVKRFHQYLYGRKFVLVTDHQPLCKIFGEKEGVPALAAARMQRWALLLGAYQFSIQHIPGKLNVCADCLSRLPVFAKRHPAEKIQAIIEIETLPVTAKQIAKQSSKDRIIGSALVAVQHGNWPAVVSKDLLPFYRRRTELSVVEGCLLWGRRVVVPQKLQASLIAELHSSHIGVSKMKSLARSYIWWPHIDREIEEVAKSCESCLLTANSPAPAPLHPWMIPKQPWERVHLDHAFWGNKVLLVAIDVFSKWPEVQVVSSTSAKQTIEKLQSIFAIHGLPITLVSDNGPPFQSDEFKSFVEANGIVHRRVPPYHPASNGAAENLVKSVKRALEKGKTTDSLEMKIAGFLATYRNTPHTVTERTPAEILLGRAPRTRLSLVHPCLSQTLSSKAELKVGNTPLRNFEEGQEVLVRDHRPNAKSKWRKAKILARLGPLSYKVTMDHQTRNTHVDHLLPADGISSREESTSESEERQSDEKSDDPTTTTRKPPRSTKPPHKLITEL